MMNNGAVEQWHKSLQDNADNVITSRSEGYWDESIQMVRVIKQKGRALFPLGISETKFQQTCSSEFDRKGTLLLFPEEAIVLQEKGILNIYPNADVLNLLPFSQYDFSTLVYQTCDLSLDIVICYSFLVSKMLIARRVSTITPKVYNDMAEDMDVAFHCYYPQTSFSKKNPPPPDFCVFVCRYEDNVPDFRSIKKLTESVDCKILIIDEEGSVISYDVISNPVPKLSTIN